MDEILTLIRLSKNYGSFRLAVDAAVLEGELLSILGPSGSGKTTTLRLIAGFESADTGKILLKGRDITTVDPSRRKIGFVFQDYTLFPHLNVFENIAYGLRARRASKVMIHSKVDELLSLVGLERFKTRSIHTLSGGERQRAALARALAIDPVLLLLDEPFSAVDAPLRKSLRLELVQLQRKLGLTMIFVTHSREEALSISSRILVMSGGKIVQSGTPTDIYENPKSKFVASFVGPANFFEGKVVGRNGSLLRVRCFADFEILSETGLSAGIGAALSFMVRPGKLKMTDVPGGNTFPARIVSRQYFAHYYEYLCVYGDHSFTVFNESIIDINKDILIRFDPSDAVVLSAQHRSENSNYADGRNQ